MKIFITNKSLHIYIHTIFMDTLFFFYYFFFFFGKQACVDVDENLLKQKGGPEFFEVRLIFIFFFINFTIIYLLLKYHFMYANFY